MDNISLKQLRYFDALSRHGHFGNAAAACAISQPALSVQIKALEESLGAVLFERTARGVTLTDIGATLAERAQAILAEVDALGEIARASQGRGLSRLRLGVIPTIAPYLLPRMIGAMTTAFPGLDLHVRETLTHRLIAELADGRLDCAIVALPVSEPSLVEEALFDEDFVLVRPREDAGQSVPDGEGLLRMRLLLLEEGHCFRDQALAFCNLPSARPRDGLDGSSLTTLVQMVAAGMGVTLIPEMAVPVEAGGNAVSVARFRDPVPSRTVGMIWRKSTPLAAQLGRIATLVRQAAA